MVPVFAMLLSMKRILGTIFAMFVILMSLPVAGQVTPISGMAVDQNGSPVPYATVRVCSVTSTGTPCTPTASIYSSYLMSPQYQIANPTTADQYGNYTVYAPQLPSPNLYLVQISPASGFTASYVVPGSEANALELLGYTWASPAAIGSTTPAAITGTTITATTQFNGSGTGLTGTAASLTAGNASALLGYTWASPPSTGYGSTTPEPVNATTVTAQSVAAGSLNGGRVFADQYCSTSTLDQSCINNAISALPNGGTVVLKPGQTYSINACQTDADAIWGVLIDNKTGIHVEGWGAAIVLNVNNNACAAVDIRGSMNTVFEGAVLLSNYNGVGTALRLHRNGGAGQQLRGNSIRNCIIGGIGTVFSPASSFAIGIDNGYTDSGQTIDNQTFLDNTFHGNNTNLIQQGIHMTNQTYVNQVMYDDSTTGVVHVNIVNGDATFIRPTLNVNPASGNTNAWVFGSSAGSVNVYDVYSEVNNDSGPYIVDQGSYGATFHGGRVIFYGTGGTSGSPVNAIDLSLANASAIYTFDAMTFSIGGAGWKGIKFPSTGGVAVLQHNTRWATNVIPFNQSGAKFYGDSVTTLAWAIANLGQLNVSGTAVFGGNTSVMSGGTLRVGTFVNPSANTFASIEQGYDGSEGIIQAYDRSSGTVFPKPIWINKGTGQPVLVDSITIGSGANISGTQGGGSKVALPIYGVSTLSSGTVTVSNSGACSASATCVYKLANCAKNSSSGIGTLSIGTVSAGTSFVINSLGPTGSVLTTDTSTVCWEIN